MVEYNWEDYPSDTPAAPSNQATKFPPEWGDVKAVSEDVGSRLRGRDISTGAPVYAPDTMQYQQDVKMVGEPSGAGAAEIFAKNAANAATLNAARHLYAAPEQIGSQKSYWDIIDEQKAREAALSRQHPIESAAATLAGTLASGYGASKILPEIPAAASATRQLAQPFITGAIGSGVASYLDEPDIKLALLNAGIGGTLTSAIQSGARVISNKLSKIPEPLDAKGNFTPDAQAIIDMAFPDLTQQQRDLFKNELADTFRQKGANISSAKEAVIKYAGGDNPTQSQATGIISREMANQPEVLAAQEATKEQIAEKLKQSQSLRPQTPDTVAANIFDAARKTRDVASSKYKQAATRTVFFDPQMADGFLSNIHRELALSQLPQNLSLTGNHPESEKIYNFIKDKFRPEVIEDTTTKPPTLKRTGNFPNMPYGPSLNAQGIEEVRQKMSSAYALAGDKDRIALDAIRRGFDNNLDQTITNKLFQGDGSKWLKEIKQARGSWSDYLDRFNSRNGPADSIFNNTLSKFRDPTTGKLSAQYDANAGAAAQGIINGKMIDPSVGPALHEKLQLTLGRNSPAMKAVDDHLKSALLGYEVNGNPSAKLLEKNITDLLTPRGRLLASKVFSNDELNQLAVAQKAIKTVNAKPLPDATKNSQIADIMSKIVNSAITKAVSAGIGAVVGGGWPGAVAGYGASAAAQSATNNLKPSIGKKITNELAGAPVVKQTRATPAVPPINIPALMPTKETEARGGRIERKSGGRISHTANADRLILAAEKAKKYINKHTEALLNEPDSTIVHALSIAKKAI